MIRDRKSKRYKQLVGEGQVVRSTITTGIHVAEGGGEHESGMTIAELGSTHEFGLGVPERSFVRAWFDERKNELREAIRLELEAGIEAGDPQKGLDKLAVTIQASIQERIANGIEPENAEVTILRKGSSTPLIDTGVLRSAILTRRDGEEV